MNKALKILLVFLGIIVIAYLAFIFIFGQDEKLANDNAMIFIFDNTPVADRDNSYIILKDDKIIAGAKEEIEKQVQSLDNGHEINLYGKILIGLRNKDQRYLNIFEKELAKSPGYSAKITEILGKPHYRLPNIKKPQDVTPSDIVLGLRNISAVAEMLPLDMAYKFAKGDEKAAMGEGLQGLAFFSKCFKSQYSDVNYIACAAGEKNIFSQMSYMAAKSSLSDAELAYYLAALKSFRPGSEYYKNSLKYKYFFFKNVIQSMDLALKGNKTQLATGDLADLAQDGWMVKAFPYIFSPNTTINKMGSYYGSMINLEYCDKPAIDGIKKTFSDYVGPVVSNRFPVFLGKNRIGKTLMSIAVIGSEWDRECERQFFENGLELVLAIQVYKKDNNRLPSGLKELTPKYISSIPKDPFGNGEIKYSLEKGIIYSIGPNFTDDGGRKKISQDTKDYDLVVDFK